MKITATAPAKLNLSLDIIGKSANGYHEILTLFQAIDLEDKLHFKFSPDLQDQVSLSLKPTGSKPTDFPLDDRNLISRAIKLFLAEYSDRTPVKIEVEIEKNIPIGAGLAGGSSNAGATLIVLNRYFGLPFTESALSDLASQLGSDVAFCLKGGLAIGRGYGEKLQALSLNLDQYFVLIKPSTISISTPWAYAAYDRAIGSSYIGVEEAERNLNKLIGQIENRSPSFSNCFEPVIYTEFPILADIKQRLIDLGCLDAHLTGSGPTIYGLVKNKEQGNQVLKNMLAADWQKQTILEGWLVSTIGHGAQVQDHEFSLKNST